MFISGDQLLQLIDIVRRDYGPLRQLQRRVPTEEEFIADILRNEFNVTGVYRPTYEVVCRDYVPVEWGPRGAGPTVAFGRGGSPTPPFQRQVLADLDTLRTSPLAALVYIIARAAGHDNATAMRYARLAQSVSRLVMIAGRAQFSRSISSTTGRVRSSPTPTVPPVMPNTRDAAWAQQQLYQRNLGLAGHAARPAGSDRRAVQPTPPLRL
jgi:hypothetical protein